MADDESMQAACLDLYRSQLSQVELSLSTCPEESSATRDDLIQLQSDLRELIQLTEESLLNLKKQRLLASLNSLTSQAEPEVNTTNRQKTSNCDINNGKTSTTIPDNLDEKFAEFQKAIASCDVDNLNTLTSVASDCTISTRDTDGAAVDDEYDDFSNDDSDEKLEENDDDLSGSKCRVTHTHSWGEMTEHNAMIICQESDLSGQKMVRIVFCNPTHSCMIPCPFYLEGRCRFSDSDCRYSHGEVVSLDNIKPFKDPDFSQVHIGSRCLAKDDDNVWYPGSVVEILPDYRFKVQYDANSAITTVVVQNILPLESNNDSGDESDQSDVEAEVNEEQNRSLNDDDDVNDMDVPVYLWNGGSTTELLGEWEKYTKGIGSKLMAKMGYIVGQGLGRNGEGRAEPVPIELLPQGKSLDKIMELRSLASDKDLFNALKKQKKMQKRIDKDAQKNAVKLDKKLDIKNNMFDFINKKLSNRSKTNSKRFEKDIKSKNISISDLKGKSDKHVNIQLFKTLEEIKKTHLELQKLGSSLTRNEKQDQVVAKQLSGKISSLNEYIKTLDTSKAFLQQELNNRKAHSSLTKF